MRLTRIVAFTRTVALRTRASLFEIKLNDTEDKACVTLNVPKGNSALRRSTSSVRAVTPGEQTTYRSLPLQTGEPLDRQLEIASRGAPPRPPRQGLSVREVKLTEETRASRGSRSVESAARWPNRPVEIVGIERQRQWLAADHVQERRRVHEQGMRDTQRKLYGSSVRVRQRRTMRTRNCRPRGAGPHHVAEAKHRRSTSGRLRQRGEGARTASMDPSTGLRCAEGGVEASGRRAIRPEVDTASVLYGPGLLANLRRSGMAGRPNGLQLIKWGADHAAAPDKKEKFERVADQRVPARSTRYRAGGLPSATT